MEQRKVFSDSVVELPDQPGVTQTGMKINLKTPAQGSETMLVSFSLNPSEEATQRLEALVAGGQTVTPQQLRTDYAVAPSELAPLLDWLKGQGYAIDHVAQDGTSVYARATVTQIESSLAVHMARVTRNGVTCTAATNAPSLPAAVAASVHAIGGLQPFRHAIKHFRRTRARAPQLEASAASTTGAIGPNGYLVADILKAYNADDLGLTGRGQTIAILIDTVPTVADLEAFWAANGIAADAARVQFVNVNDMALPPTEGEETLDAEWASGIASGATVRVYASGGLDFALLDKALDQIIADFDAIPSMRQLSVSLGLGETYMQKAEVRSQHAKYLRLAALGVNVFVSSGDAGSNPDTTGQSSTGPLQVEYGSSDSAVIGVGGTTMDLGADGMVRDESGWADGGGGRSVLFKRPAWQAGDAIPQGGARLVPDVGLVADPNTGAMIVHNGQQTQIGGTSWSAPVWAGFCALVNEARATNGKPPLPFLPPLLYPLGGTAAFRDIVAGSNGAYHASTGYDMVTGLGVPDVRVLVQQLA